MGNTAKRKKTNKASGGRAGGVRRRRSGGRKVKGLPLNVRRHAHLLCVLAKAKPKLARQIIAGAGPDLVKTISECSYNIVKGHVRLTAGQRKRLSRYKKALRDLTYRKMSTPQRKALMQKGGFLPILGSVLAPLIAPLMGTVLNKIIG